MKLNYLKYIAVLPLIYSFVGIANANNANNAKNERFYLAPFSHVEVKAASKIYVNYKFSADEQLVCQSEDNNAITSAEWTYKNATRKIDLPVVLKDNSQLEGHYADPQGILSITNEFGSSISDGSIFVSCEYRIID